MIAFAIGYLLSAVGYRGSIMSRLTSDLNEASSEGAGCKRCRTLFPEATARFPPSRSLL